jgi:DNA end-binding protein Ku
MSRPIWKGSISFGLVNIPIELVMAVHEKSIHFHMLSKDGTCRLRRKLYCPETGKEYDFQETARGIEIAPEEYALVDKREIDRLKPEKGRAMEILQFTDLKAIDPVYYDRVYYVRPAENSYKSFKLLVEALQKMNKCAIAQFVMRERQYTAVIRVLDEGMVLHTLHYADEVEPIQEAVPQQVQRAKVTTAEVTMATELIKAMSKPLDLDKFKDEFREQLEDLIEAKVKGKELVRASDDREEAPAPTINLMDALRKSLEQRPAGQHKRRRSA